MIEAWPNLKCILVRPTINLFSFKIEIYGKWYNPASGLLDVASNIIKKEIDPITNVYLIRGRIWKLFLHIINKNIKDRIKIKSAITYTMWRIN